MTLSDCEPHGAHLIMKSVERAVHHAADSRWRRAVPSLPALLMRLPQFPLEVVLRGVEPAPPCVLAEAGAPDARILFANAAAASLGVRAGMSAKAVRVFGPEIRRLVRNAAAETQAGTQLVRWLQALGYHVHAGQCADGALDVHAVSHDGRAAALLPQLRRELRVLGYRATLTPMPALNPQAVPAPLAAARRAAGGTFSASIELPWSLARPGELYPAVGRLLEELRILGSAEQMPLKWIQWTFQQVSGARDHHVFALDPPGVSIARLGALTRERLHRLPEATPWRAVALKAGR